MKTFRFLLFRLLQAIPLVIGVVCINFVIIQMAPGDAVEVLAGEAGTASAEYMADLRARFGLDKPAWQQLLAMLMRVAQFDLGYSFRHNLPVADLILSRLPATLLLMGTAITAAFVTGTALGIVAARQFPHRRRYLDRRLARLCHPGVLDRSDVDCSVLGGARLAAVWGHDDNHAVSVRHGCRC